jgi:threonine dehydratase
MPQRPKIADNMLQLIGYTPLVRLNHIAYPNSAEMIVKLESQNPMDSVKDRIGAAMIEAAERNGKLRREKRRSSSRHPATQGSPSLSPPPSKATN